MGLYREQVLPRFINVACASREMRQWRLGVVRGLAGRIVEIGFGSGLNVELYPDGVTEVLAVEPAGVAWRLAAQRVAQSPVTVEHVGLDGAALPIDDASCDGALSTFTLCTIPDVEGALAELRRVLRPGAALHFLEHGLAPDAAVAGWQHRMDPLQVRLFDGCHLTRDPVALVGNAGFDIDRVEQRYGKGPKPWSYFTTGVATAPTAASPPA